MSYNEFYTIVLKMMKISIIPLEYCKENTFEKIFSPEYDNSKLLLNCLKYNNNELFHYLYDYYINDERNKILSYNYNNFNYYKDTLLKESILNFDNETLKKLIKEININNSDDLILYKGLDLICRTGDYKKLLILMELNPILNLDNCNLLTIASKFGHIKIVKYFLDKGMNIHGNEDKALRFTCRHNHIKMVKFLIKNGANIHAKNNYALSVSLFNNLYKIFEYLLKKGADIHYNDDILLLDCFNQEYIENFKYLLNKKNLNIHCHNDYIIKFINLHFDKINNKEIIHIIIPYYYHYSNLNLKDEFFNIYRFNNCNNPKCQILYDNYQLLKKELINKINLLKY